MNKLVKSLAVFALGLSLVSPALAGDRRGEQGNARDQVVKGKAKSLREIEARVLPTKRGMKYVGFNYDAANNIYRLRFIKEGRVVFVDVDAQTGNILREIQ